MSRTNQYFPVLRAPVGNGLPGRPMRGALSSSGDFYSKIVDADMQAVSDGAQLLFGSVYNRADYPSVEGMFPKGNPRLAFSRPENFMLGLYGASRAVVSPDGSKFVAFSLGNVHVYATGTRALIATGTTQQGQLQNGPDSMFWVDNSTFYIATRSSDSSGAGYLDVCRVPTSGGALIKTSAIAASNNWIMSIQAVFESATQLVLGWSNNNYGAGKITIVKSTGVATVQNFAQGAPNLKAICAFKRAGRPVAGAETYLEIKSSVIQVRNIVTGAILKTITGASGSENFPSSQQNVFSSDGYVYVCTTDYPAKLVRLSPDGSFQVLGALSDSSPMMGIYAVDEIRRVVLSHLGVHSYGDLSRQEPFAPLLLTPSASNLHRVIGIAPYSQSIDVIDYAIGARADSDRSAVAYSGASEFLVELPPDQRVGFKI